MKDGSKRKTISSGKDLESYLSSLIEEDSPVVEKMVKWDPSSRWPEERLKDLKNEVARV